MALLVLDARETHIKKTYVKSKRISIYEFVVLLKIFISLYELLVWFSMPAFGTSNSVPYVPRLLLLWPGTSHNEVQLKLFCGVKKKLHA